jgi:microcin C transport system permease protein
MASYLLKRVLLIIPTMFGIMLISFAVIQFAPGGPVERVIAQITGTDVSATARIGGSQGDGLSGTSNRQSSQSRARAVRSTVARKVSIRSLSSNSRSNSASISPPTSASS